MGWGRTCPNIMKPDGPSNHQAPRLQIPQWGPPTGEDESRLAALGREPVRLQAMRSPRRQCPKLAAVSLSACAGDRFPGLGRVVEHSSYSRAGCHKYGAG